MSLPRPTVWRQPETNSIVTSRDMLKAVRHVPDILGRHFPIGIKGGAYEPVTYDGFCNR